MDRDLSDEKREHDLKHDTDPAEHPHEVQRSCIVLLHACLPGHYNHKINHKFTLG